MLKYKIEVDNVYDFGLEIILQGFPDIHNHLIPFLLVWFVGVKLETIKIMIYKDSFVENLDNYKKGFVTKVYMLIFSTILLGVFSWMLISVLKKIYWE